MSEYMYMIGCGKIDEDEQLDAVLVTCSHGTVGSVPSSVLPGRF